MPRKTASRLTNELRLKYALGLLVVAILSSALTILGVNTYSWLSPDKSSAPYLHDIPFDRLDAVHLCEDKAKVRFGDKLVRTDTDWRSTRFQADKHVYLVILNGSIGNYEQHEKAKIYCYVDPDDQYVSYFKAYDLEGRSMLSRNISMDTMLEGLSGP
ncbi:hypothetical protein [Pseudomaricurvus sp.]|uniref:hypothetical protein n=1 Tax=Pseudomaricurvus sp. TaxID=2004510 RepID=UPI003F6B2273